MNIADSFKEWFKSGKKELLDKIYEILDAQRNPNDDELTSIRTSDLALNQLGLQLNESFVLEVLAHGRDVLSCLKFFDWAGRQPYFTHTRATFHAIFKILWKAKLMSVLFDFLHTFEKHRYAQKVRFYDTLVIGYSVAGKPEIALHLFGKMRFQGLDLDSFAYHVLLNSLTEGDCFNAFEIILEQIRLRGFENQITQSIIMKILCKQNKLDEAEEHLNWLVTNGKILNGREMTVLVDALCENNKFERAAKLVEEFGNSGLVPEENSYGVWIRDLVQAERLDEALEFFRQKQSSKGYIPGLSRYNILTGKLLRKNRLHEVYDLLMEMKENHIRPDMVTMNTALCFFCKAGMVDVALELYNSRSQFGLCPNCLAYKLLIISLLQSGSVNEAYSVLKKLIVQGYFIDRGVFTAVTNALFKECKVDEMEELLILALERGFVPSASTYDKLISALCHSGRVGDAYLMHGQLNNVTTRKSYFRLILAFCKSNMAHIVARLLMEMREKGHIPTQSLYRAVICSLLERDSSKTHFLYLLEILSRGEEKTQIYSFFIKAAGHAKKPELAREVYEIMRRNDINPTSYCHIYMLQSYLNNKRILEALNFFSDLQQQGIENRKLYNCLIFGLCKAERPDMALRLLSHMRIAKLTPPIACYEVLVQELCRMKRYTEAINFINDYEKMGRRLTSFIGNVLLLHSLSAPELFDTCVHLRGVSEEEFSGSSMLSLIIGAFSGRLRVNHRSEDLEELIEKCFPLDSYTYNLLLTRESRIGIDQACEFFKRMCQKGYVPNQVTFDTMLHAFLRHGRKAEAKPWFEEMFQRGFFPKYLLLKMQKTQTTFVRM